jgi:hypothetical protein
MSSSQRATQWHDAETRAERPWKPSVGDQLIGKVADLDTRTVTWKDQSKKVPVIIVDSGDPDHLDAVWGLHAVMVSELQKHKPQIGEEVAFTRLPDSISGSYKRYRIAVNREPHAFQWDAFDPAAAGDVEPARVKLFEERPANPPKTYDDFEAPELEGDDSDLPF